MAVKYILFPLATAGNRVAVPDPSQPSGNLSWQDGFPINYQLDPATEPTAKLIERQQFNQFMFDLSTAVQQYQQFGVPDFISTADNGGTPFSYSQFARVRYNPGSGTKLYESLVDTNTALPTDSTKWAVVPSAGASGIPAGAQMAYGGNTAPDGWLLCAGQAVSRTTFAALFANIGTNYGIGDGITTFNVPDKRGRGSIGKDDMGGTPANRITNAVCGIQGTQIGAVGGDQRTQLHTHNAVVTDPGHSHTFIYNVGFAANGGGNGLNNPPPHNTTSDPQIGAATTGVSVANDNFGAGSSQNVQPSQVDNWIIKT